MKYLICPSVFVSVCFCAHGEDIIFDKSEKTLSAFGKVWKAHSGSKNHPEIKNGTYKIPKKSLMVGTEKVSGVPQDDKYKAKSYQDSKGFGWFCWVGSGNLGIHPDGGPSGTEGCIGLLNEDTRDLFDALRKVYNDEHSLIVRD